MIVPALSVQERTQSVLSGVTTQERGNDQCELDDRANALLGHASRDALRHIRERTQERSMIQGHQSSSGQNARIPATP